MNAPIRVAEVTGAASGLGKKPAKVLKVIKAESSQAVSLEASYDGTVKVDFSAVANENITLVHIGEKLIVLFDNQSTVTIIPFFDSMGVPLANIAVESDGKDFTAGEFASTFPITTDQSVLPAAGDGAAGTPASGANFNNASVDPLLTPDPLPLLPPEQLLGIEFTTIEPFPTGNDEEVNTEEPPTVNPNAIVSSAIVDDEGILPNGIIGDPAGLGGDVDLPDAENVFIGNLNPNFNGDTPAATDPISFAGMVGPGVVNGEAVTYAWDSATNTLTATSVRGGLFTIQVDGGADTGDGNFVFTLERPLLHNPGGGENNITFDLTYQTTDDDGGFADNILTVTVDDDGPSVTGVEVGSSVALDETDAGEAFVSGPISATSLTSILSATLLFGADDAAAADSTVYSLSLTGDGTTSLETAEGDFPITLVVISDTEIQGQYDGTNVAFSVVINADGTLTVTQNVALEHLTDGPTPADHDDTLDLDGLITATVAITDSDGYTASGSAEIGAAVTFDDDGPSVTGVEVGSSVALDETDAGEAFVSGPISATSLTSILSATLLFGADDAAAADSTVYSLSLTGDGTTSLETAEGDFPITLVVISDTEIQGQYDGTNVAFSVVINADGTLTVTQNVALEHLTDGPTPADHDDTLDLDGLITATVAITDSDGDTASGSAEIGAAVTFDDDGPNAVIANVTAAAIVLDESPVPAAGDGTVSATADFSVNFATSPTFGADGPGDVGYKLVLTGTNALSGLYALDATDTESVIDGIGQGAEIVLNQDGLTGVITGSVGGTDYFTIEVDPATGEVTFTQSNNIWHGDTSDNDDAETLTLDSADLLQLVQTVTDADGDSDTAALNLGTGVFTIEDDGPVLNGIQDGMIANVAATLHGEIDIDFGTDEFGSFDLAGVPPSGISYNTVNNPDGSATLTATIDGSGDTYFILTVNADSTYDFQLVTPNPSQTVTTSLTGLTAGGPVPQLVLALDDITATVTELAPTPGAGGINSSSNGMGVDNNLIAPGETLRVQFSEDITNIALDINKLSTSDDLSWAVYNGGVLIASGTWNPPPGSGENSDTTLDLLNPSAGSVLTYTTGSAAAIEANGFDEVRLGSTDGDYRLLSMSTSKELLPGDVDLHFDLVATDGDGDSVTTNLDISIEGDGTEATGFGTEATGFVLTGTAANEVLLGGLGADDLTGGAGVDKFVLSSTAAVDDILDYQTGEIVDLTQLLDVAPGTDLVAGGYVKVINGGATDTLQIDVNGGANNFVNIATLSYSGGVTEVVLQYLENGAQQTQNVAAGP